MQIILNGEPRDLDSALSVEGLLSHLGLEGRKVAVERNLEIVPHSAYDEVLLEEGDRIEIVHFVGGG
ncbi:sulfur carrier protein ThiS [Tepidicaulis sp.]|jgi:thiamine biosynthesis protein ThiS|uniref:sulfur carrier protein ThiS n=1 Tax=Tepidicaulis sp. TaxID=1920809 RepID=UPI003B5BE4B9